jgi:hypothetical protein
VSAIAVLFFLLLSLLPLLFLILLIVLAVKVSDLSEHTCRKKWCLVPNENNITQYFVLRCFERPPFELPLRNYHSHKKLGSKNWEAQSNDDGWK